MFGLIDQLFYMFLSISALHADVASAASPSAFLAHAPKSNASSTAEERDACPVCSVDTYGKACPCGDECRGNCEAGLPSHPVYGAAWCNCNQLGFWDGPKVEWNMQDIEAGVSLYGGCEAATWDGASDWVLTQDAWTLAQTIQGSDLDETFIRIQDGARMDGTPAVGPCAFKYTSRHFDLTKVTQIDFDVTTGCVEGREGCTGKWFALWLQPLSEDPSQYSKDHPHDNKYFGEIDLVECYNCDQSGQKPATNFDTCGDGSYSKEDCNQYTWDGFEAVGLKAHVTMYNDPESGSVLVRPCRQGVGACPQDGDGGHINLAVTKQWDYRQYTMIADLWDMSNSGFYVEFGNIKIQEE